MPLFYIDETKFKSMRQLYQFQINFCVSHEEKELQKNAVHNLVEIDDV